MTETLIEHHVKYKEIHGVDETIWMTRSAHKLLHNRLRRNGQCNISPEKLQHISATAFSRTNKSKEKRQKLLASKSIIERNTYPKQYVRKLIFEDLLNINVYLREEIVCNLNTGSIRVSCYFVFNNHKKYPVFT